MKQGECVEDLQCGGLKIIQNKNLYTFTSDSVILANLLRTKQSDAVCEIGAGSGVISILVQAKNKLKKIVAFEIQPEMADLARRNVELNNLTDRIEVMEGDAREFKKYVNAGTFSVVFSNPPYFKQTDFKQSDVNKIAKEEVCLNPEQLCEAANGLLKSGGAFYVCYPAERSAEIMYIMQKHRLTPKEFFFTENGKGKVKTVFIKAVKDGKFGVTVHPNLVTNDESGNYLETLHTKYFL